ncbi:MAG: hypothetical protein II640_02580 [Lachnospiraceae bacterium]|nr:hypothetical protein [Lachnospiraceae bacterium]
MFYAKEGYFIVSLAWIILSLAGALPFFISGSIPDYIDAFFECVSGFTTTGASILEDVEAMPMSMLYWRSFTHWLGGMGVLVLILAIMQSGSGGSTLHILRAESPGPSVGKIVPKMRRTAQILYGIYIAMTVTMILALVISGMDVFKAVCYTFGTAVTGGFGTLEVSEEDLISLAGMARRVSEETLLRYIRVFSELSGKIRQVPDKRVLLEMTFIKLIRPETEYNLDAVLNRLELLEQRMAAGYVPAGGSAAPGAGGQAGPGGQGNAGMSPSPAGQSRPQRPPVRMTGDQKEQMAILKENWSQVMSALDSKSAKLSLQRARLLPDERGTGFVIQFQDEKSYTIGAREPYLKAVSEAILKVTGIEMALRFAGPASARDGEPGEQELSKVFHGVKIENED